MADWQTIDTAPKDGSRILTWSDHLGRVVAFWFDPKVTPEPVGWIEAGRDAYTLEPTHWMPLPDPPTDEFITLPRMEME